MHRSLSRLFNAYRPAAEHLARVEGLLPPRAWPVPATPPRKANPPVRPVPFLQATSKEIHP